MRILNLLPMLGLASSITNPIPSLLDETFTDMADPCILEHDGQLHVYPTASQSDFSVWSAPLPPARDSTFDPSALLFEKNSTPVLEPPGSCLLTTLIPALGKGTLTWAPHVHRHVDGRFYMYYSSCLTLYVASSDTPMGPFQDPVQLMYLAIDPFVYQDEESGKLFLYYANVDLKRIWAGEESIYVAELSTPTTLASGSGGAAHTQLIKPDQHPWEFFRSSLVAPRGINEGPWMFKSEETGTYYLMYSGAGADTSHYSIGVATSKGPAGPFVKSGENPVVSPQDSSSVGVYGPGHHAVWEDKVGGRRWAFYHRKGGAEAGWDRALCVDEVVVVEERGGGAGTVSIAVTP